jgi:L-histidine N-alpha-methyltransferase
MTSANINTERTLAAPKPSIENKTFFKEVMEGLSSTPKYLQSKYFYDATGDSLFRRIMECDEYYPFRCELEIFRESSKQLADAILQQKAVFDLIELGAGDCSKSNFLLKELVAVNADFTFRPIDISGNIIDFLHHDLPETIPGINAAGLNGEYFEMLEKVAELSNIRKVILFLGSNLGNMLPKEGLSFCQKLRRYLNPGDMVILGLDLKKNPATTLAAYNDKAGFTRAFNLNLLHRINRELNADFDTGNFEHYPSYDPQNGSCKSYLISVKEQTVTFNTKDKSYTIHFRENEEIYMEVSQKYTVEQINALAEQASFRPVKMLFDKRKWFVDTIWEVI